MIDHFIKSAFILVILLMGLGGCLSEVDIFPEKDNLEKFSCRVNGEVFEATSGKGLLAIDFIMAEMQQTENSYLLTVFGVDIQDSGEALAVGFRLGGSNPEDIRVGDNFTAWVPMGNVEGAFAGAKGGVEKRESAASNETVFRASSDPAGEINLTVTSIDLAEKKISGTFRFTAQQEESEILIEVTEGVFENVQWNDLAP